MSYQYSNVLNKRIIKHNYIVKVLDKDFSEIPNGDLSPFLITAPSINISADNDVRRTCSFDLKVTNRLDFSNFWTDKYIKVQIKVYDDIYTERYHIQQLGVFAISTPSETYDINNKVIHLSCLDLMGCINGSIKGSLLGNGADEYVIPASKVDDVNDNSSISNAIIQTVIDSGIFLEEDTYGQNSKIIVPEISIEIDGVERTIRNIPYDIKVSADGTYYDVLSELLALIPTYQMYFDEDANFIVSKIPSGEYEDVTLTNDMMQKVLIGYERSLDYGSIKNEIEVYGGTFDGDINTSIVYADTTNHIAYVIVSDAYWEQYYGSTNSSTPVENLTYVISKPETIVVNNQNVNISSFYFNRFVVLSEYTRYSTPDSLDYTENYIRDYGYNSSALITRATYNINFSDFMATAGSGISYMYYDGTTTLPTYTPANCSVFSFRVTSSSCKYVGYQPYCKIVETNTNSPFHASKIGARRMVCMGGEYENIFNQAQCDDRAKYELYNRCRVNDTVTTTTISIFNIDVNELVELVLPENILGLNDVNVTNSELGNKFMIKEISYGGATMTMTLMRYYPNLEDIIN